ncbi:uncharacterized protein LOC133311659 [Gastrolobium bilobum]|uniref:uncharacterized protein LOC133311659 n=1 Tax=Gastrolobium bilobum TaxID=150636 RepID=UPI002AB20DF6|nr:uncharacterized protein LOC133311659 [Gastrolobium bilobum]
MVGPRTGANREKGNTKGVQIKQPVSSSLNPGVNKENISSGSKVDSPMIGMLFSTVASSSVKKTGGNKPVGVKSKKYVAKAMNGVFNGLEGNSALSSEKSLGEAMVDVDPVQEPEPPDQIMSDSLKLLADSAGMEVALPLKEQLTNTVYEPICDSDLSENQSYMGAAKKQFKSTFSRFRKNYKVGMVAILEPRVIGNKAASIIRSLGFSNKLIVEAHGFSGGIWLVWNSCDVNISLISQHDQFIHCWVEVAGLKGFFWAAVYVNPQEGKRRLLWEELKQIGRTMDEAWLLTGDFNEITSAEEKRGGGPIDYSRCIQFANVLSACGVLDLGGGGNRFTWRGPKFLHLDRVFKRLDRAVENENWRASFQDADVLTLPRLFSDHCPVLVRLEKEEVGWRERPFRFLASWQADPRFSNLIKANWNQATNLYDGFHSFTPVLKDWNKNVFGFIQHKKNKIIARLDGIQKQSSSHPSRHFEKLEAKLRKELSDILDQDEQLWHQKSKGDWIRDGDRNTRFYHTSTLIRRKRNKVLKLQDEAGHWINGEEELIALARNFFINLFKEEISVPIWLHTSNSWPEIKEDQLESLSLSVGMEEVKCAFFQMAPLKAPGPDGFPALFFQRNWKILKDQVLTSMRGYLDKPQLIQEINYTMLALIPKIERPCLMKQFRPIALCNSIYKGLSKILANKIKPLLGSLISPNQPGDLVEAIMDCVTSTHLEVLWNRGRTTGFSPQRGIRQGDPISPYLFVLCMEKLTHLIMDEVEAKHWRPIKAGKSGPYISHLMFADDVILFAEASLSQLESITHCLEKFSKMSGQCEIERLQRNFIWGDSETKRKAHYISWEQICQPRECGGLGIMNLRRQNEAFMQKLAWKVMTDHDRLWVKVLLGKYGRNANPSRCLISRTSDSPLWKHICRGYNDLYQHLEWKIGNGKEIYFWSDVWGGWKRSLYDLAAHKPPDSQLSFKVSDYVDQVTGDWRWSCLVIWLDANTISKLKNIRTPAIDGPDDNLNWIWSSPSKSFVRNAYCHFPESGERDRVWAAIWKWRGPYRFAVFLWLASLNKIPVRAMTGQWYWGESMCPACKIHPETVMHVLRDCRVARQVWERWFSRNIPKTFLAVEGREWFKISLFHPFVNKLWGSWKELASNIGSSGGFLCSSVGEWKGGFSYNIGNCTALEAELWGIYHGCKLASDMQYSKVWIGCDSKEALLCLEENDEVCGFSYLIGKIREVALAFEKF